MIGRETLARVSDELGAIDLEVACRSLLVEIGRRVSASEHRECRTPSVGWS